MKNSREEFCAYPSTSVSKAIDRRENLQIRAVLAHHVELKTLRFWDYNSIMIHLFDITFIITYNY